jgi:hypothetical protein
MGVLVCHERQAKHQRGPGRWMTTQSVPLTMTLSPRPPAMRLATVRAGTSPWLQTIHEGSTCQSKTPLRLRLQNRALKHHTDLEPMRPVQVLHDLFHHLVRRYRVPKHPVVCARLS